VLLCALLRIVTGMLADRYVGRVVFSLLLIVVAVPEYLVPMVSSYKLLLYVAFFLGMAGSSFAVGVGFVSHWEFMGWGISVSRLRSSWHGFGCSGGLAEYFSRHDGVADRVGSWAQTR